MVNIITGPVNSGKTSRLLSEYESRKKGDGFMLPKVFIGESYAGQHIVRLSSKEGIPFSYKRDFIPEHWNELYRLDNYSFSKDGFSFAEKIIENIIKNSVSPVYLDELGPLELQEAGFYELFKRLLEKADMIYVCVRSSCLESIIDKFGITRFSVITD
jgi:nucleoside-triphosphatase THEP1